MASRDATETPWRVAADAPAGLGPHGRSLGTVLRHAGGTARGRRVPRLCPPSTSGAPAVQAAEEKIEHSLRLVWQEMITLWPAAGFSDTRLS